MTLLRLLLLLLATHLVTLSAWAVIYSNTEKTFKGIIKLESSSGGICTGSVTGFNPPTVITARHCAEMGAVKYQGHNPNHILTENFNGHYFSTETARLPGDVAVLVFLRSSEATFRKAMSEKDLFDVHPGKISSWQEVAFCGFGAAGEVMQNFRGVGTQRCGYNYVLGKVAGSSNTFPDAASSFENLNSESKANYIYDLVQRHVNEFGVGTRLAFASLVKNNDSVSYDADHRLALTQWGDSGGPVFITDSMGQKQIISITSASLSTNFRQGPGLFVAAYSWRLDHPWTQELLKRAVYQGADIKGYL